jgi:copper chaperone CopZ
MKTKLKIEGMNCISCVAHIEKALEAIPRVKEAAVTLGEGATVEHENADQQKMIRAVAAAGDYKAEVVP